MIRSSLYRPGSVRPNPTNPHYTAAMKLSEKSLICEACGGQMPIQTKGRMSRFCNDTCKNRGHRQRKKLLLAEAETLKRAGLALTLASTDNELVVTTRGELDRIQQQARQLIEDDLRQLKQKGHDLTTEGMLKILTLRINALLTRIDQLGQPTKTDQSGPREKADQ